MTDEELQARIDALKSLEKRYESLQDKRFVRGLYYEKSNNCFCAIGVLFPEAAKEVPYSLQNIKIEMPNGGPLGNQLQSLNIPLPELRAIQHVNDEYEENGKVIDDAQRYTRVLMYVGVLRAGAEHALASQVRVRELKPYWDVRFQVFARCRDANTLQPLNHWADHAWGAALHELPADTYGEYAVFGERDRIGFRRTRPDGFVYSISVSREATEVTLRRPDGSEFKEVLAPPEYTVYGAPAKWPTNR